MQIIQIDPERNVDYAIAEAVRVLTAGGTVVYPTDTLYGLGANATDPEAVARVFRVKKRHLSKPLPIIARNLAWVKELAYVSPRNEEILKKIWPGKVTVILPKKDIIPEIVSGGTDTIGIRIPDYPLVDRLLKLYGYPITSSSANISGDEPSSRIDDIIEMFKWETQMPDLIIDAGTLPASLPSTVLDLTTSKPKILRVGPSKPEDLLKLLNL